MNSEGFCFFFFFFMLLNKLYYSSYIKGLFKIYPSFINTEYMQIKKRYDIPNYISTLAQSEKRDIKLDLPK